MTQHVKTEVTAGIMTITLARAEKKNALSNEMYSAMSDGLERAEKDPAVRVVLFQISRSGGNYYRSCRPTEGRNMSVADFIRSEVNANEILLFMKGTPTAPACGFSAQVVRILDHLGVPFRSHDIYQSEELRQGIKDYSDWPTIPQLYVRGEFVGGCDIVTEMFRSGELQALLLKQPQAEQS